MKADMVVLTNHSLLTCFYIPSSYRIDIMGAHSLGQLMSLCLYYIVRIGGEGDSNLKHSPNQSYDIMSRTCLKILICEAQMDLISYLNK